MKKFIGMLLVCGLVSCSSCSGPKVDPVVPGAVSNDKWSLTLPSSNWQYDLTNALNELRDAGDPGTMVILLNQVDKNLVVVATESFTGSSQAYALLSIRGLADTGRKLVGASKTVSINDVNYVMFESAKADEPTIWAWITVKNGTAYSFVCGGLETSDEVQHGFCNQIVSSLRLK
jgi:hypothetical protein